ncbi:VOC family protein [Ktedonosporobacter rubrisoli]|uniref:VOC family protein n=1 Tax=Ktedonosporobacter rubrisoli TaxID=2509675 RepID=UPI0013EE6893|nr:VOC family protein [Ktedonosporobacter rubrisoli]
MRYQGINHVSILVRNNERARHFFVDVLGFRQHKRIPVWFVGGSGVVHAVEIPDAPMEKPLPYDVVRHAAFQVDDLQEVLARLLRASLKPYQVDMQMQQKFLTDPNDDLSYGTETVFVADYDGNLFEFVQIGRGLFVEEADLFQEK